MRRRDLEFEVNDQVYIKITAMKGVMRFCKKGKLSPIYVGLYHILKHIRKGSYEFDLPNDLAPVHMLFHVSMLMKSIGDLTSIIRLEGLEVEENFSNENVFIEILAR